MKLFRLAKPSDYVYNKELELWELTFDKRPVAGTKCENPIEGAALYNRKRQAFLLNYHKGQMRFKWELQVTSFKDILIRAVSDKATNKECWYISQLLKAKTETAYYQIANTFLSDKSFNLPIVYKTIIGLIGYSQRFPIDLDLLNKIEKKARKWIK